MSLEDLVESLQELQDLRTRCGELEVLAEQRRYEGTGKDQIIKRLRDKCEILERGTSAIMDAVDEDWMFLNSATISFRRPEAGGRRVKITNLGGKTLADIKGEPGGESLLQRAVEIASDRRKRAKRRKQEEQKATRA